MEVKGTGEKGSVVVEDGETAHAVSGRSSKKKTEKEKAKKLAEDSKVRPVEKSNQDLFEKLEQGDQTALKNLKAKVRSMSGSDVQKVKKEESHDIDIFFFKS